MGVLQRFERRLEGLVQGAFAKTFGGWVEPVEIAAALTREAEDKKAIVAAGRVLVPNAYVVELAPADAERLQEYDEPLRAELAAMVSEAAVEQGWSFVGPVQVSLTEVTDLSTGAFRVLSSVVAGDTLRSAGAHLTAVGAESGATGPRLVDGERTIPLGPSTILGRGAEAEVTLTDTGVSRRHVELRVFGDRVELHDLGSTNGTRVNGQRVESSTLVDGDRITVGTTDLVFWSGR